MKGPLLTMETDETLRNAARSATPMVQCSLDLKRSTTTVAVDEAGWSWNSQRFPFVPRAKDRTIYYWAGEAFEPVSRFTSSLIKLVPTEWGPPTFEIDGIKMLPTMRVSPYADAKHKVSLIEPRGKVVLDTCGGLGYFAACTLDSGASRVLSFEKNADVMWLRSLNPWSPEASDRLALTHGDITQHVASMPRASVDAILHDPPRFGIAGELYSQAFYEELARVLKPNGKLFHYTGTPNKLTSGRDVPNEVAQRLRQAGFATEISGDGVLAVRKKGLRSGA